MHQGPRVGGSTESSHAKNHIPNSCSTADLVSIAIAFTAVAGFIVDVPTGDTTKARPGGSATCQACEEQQQATGKKRLSGRAQEKVVRRAAATWRFLHSGVGTSERPLLPKVTGTWVHHHPKSKVLHNHDIHGRPSAWGLLGLQPWPPPQLEDELLKKGGVMSWAYIPIETQP